jgi:hypothetical protein
MGKLFFSFLFLIFFFFFSPARVDVSSSQNTRVVGRFTSQVTGGRVGSGQGGFFFFFFFFFTGTTAEAWRHIGAPLATKFWGFVDRRVVYPVVLTIR